MTLTLLVTWNVCSLNLNAQTIEIRKTLLDSIYAKIATIPTYKMELDSMGFLLSKCARSSEWADSIIAMQQLQVKLYREAIDTFTKDLNKKSSWYNNIYVGILIGAGMIYTASVVVENVGKE